MEKIYRIARFLLISLATITISHTSLAQISNNMCEGALPFCTGTPYSFPAGTGTPSAQTGPFYSCLGSTPNPAWYYMKIAQAGMIQITMHSEPSHDIDFCLWGPFDTQNSCGMLTSSKMVDCSYSLASTEVVDIPNAVLGKYYILIITNYSNAACNIVFSQTGGTGVTDCTILPPAAGNDGPLCVGETLHLGAANMNNAVYHWMGPDGWSSSLQNPIRPNVQLTNAGTYALFVTINGVPSADTNHTFVAIFNKPTATISGGGSICSGDSSLVTITCQNQPPWNVTYTVNGLNPTTVPILVSPYVLKVHPTVTTTYSLTQVSNPICTSLALGSVAVTVNQKPVPDFSYNNNCSGYPSHFTDISSVSGGYATAWHWNFGVAGDTSDIQNPTYAYANGGTYDVQLKVTSNNGCTAVTSKPVVISPTPLTNAGPDKTIPYGTNTTLQGVASGGSGSYSYHWEPAGQLIDPDVSNPVTVNLANSTDYTLTVTDAGNACQQSDVATVIITGGPLGIQLAAEPAALCSGTHSNLNLQPGGGSGNYTYSWSSNPPGFTSSLEDITVQPDVTTAYTVVVNDGFSNVTKTVTVTVYDNPVVDAGSDQTIPFGTSTYMNGNATSGAPPLTYSWSPSNLVMSSALYNTPTTILTNTTNFTLTVVDGHGCLSSNQILITISGGALKVYPQAQKSPICIGESTTLNPMSEGGSGNYTYTWTSGNGFQSHAIVPEVTPLQTTIYHLEISDGFTTNSGDVTVKVYPLPVINLIPPGAHVIGTDTIQACVFDTVTISAAGANLAYLWSNGAITPSVQSTTTGIAFDMLTYSVNVINTFTLCSNSAALTVIYTYDDCSYGIPDINDNMQVSVYPNPGNGMLTCSLQSDYTHLASEILNAQGATLQRNSFTLHAGGVQKFPVDISGLPSGVYFLKLYNDSFLRIVKIVKY